MKRLRCRLTCIITLLVVTVGSILNPVFTLRSQAAEVVVGEALIDYLVSLAMSVGVTYFGYELIDRNSTTRELTAYCNTSEGSDSLHKLFTGGKPVGSGSESFEDSSDILDSDVSGLVLTPELFEFLSGYYEYIMDSANGSELGAAITTAADQDVSYEPFPANWHFSSIDKPVYSLNSIGILSSKYDHFGLEGNYFVEITKPYGIDNFMVCPPDGTNYVWFRIDRTALYYGTNYINESGQDQIYFGYNYIRNFQTDECNYYKRSSSYYNVYGATDTDVYMCGNVHFSYEGESYILNPDGTIVQVVEGQPDQLVVPHVTTAEGYLTSAKPIVNMDIMSLIDAIGKAIADAFPDEAPVLSQEAINQIYNNVSNVYDNAVTNYYNDTSYIDQSQYITNVTNVFEQAIADNPVIDLPVADTGILSGIKAIPGQIANVLADVFIPDLSLLQGYIELLLGYFSWAIEPWNFFQDLINIIFVDNPEPPKIYIDFSKAESSYIYGGKAVVLDMSWYARYKPYADTIIVSFSYIWFAYWFFRNLPEIISGGSPVPVARSAERAAARMDEEIKRADPEYGRVKVDAVGSITSSKGIQYSGARSAHHNIQDDQMRPKL